MSIEIRPLTAEDREVAQRLGHEAFGMPTQPQQAQPQQAQAQQAQAEGEDAKPQEWPPPGTHHVGAFDDGRLVAKVVGKEYASYFGGTEIPTWGISGVTVEVEHRGRGLLTELFRHTFGDAETYGAALSTLFPTAPGIYRKFGYELVGAYQQYAVPTTALASVRPGTGVRVRRAGVDDLDAIGSVYRQWAQQQNGPLTRTGPCFAAPPQEVLDRFTGISVAVDEDDTVVGYTSWERGHTTDRVEGTIEVEDLIGLTPDAVRALARTLGSFGTVSGRVLVEASGFDLAPLVLPTSPWRSVRQLDYMLSVLDPVPAVELRRYPALLSGTVGFTVGAGPFDGPASYAVEVADGRATCTPDDEHGQVHLTRQGLAMLYAGVQTLGNLRLAGHATGGDPAADAGLDAVFAGRPLHIRDFF